MQLCFLKRWSVPAEQAAAMGDERAWPVGGGWLVALNGCRTLFQALSPQLYDLPLSGVPTRMLHSGKAKYFQVFMTTLGDSWLHMRILLHILTSVEFPVQIDWGCCLAAAGCVS